MNTARDFRLVLRFARAVQKHIEAELNDGAPPLAIAAVLTDLAITTARRNHTTAYATLTGMAEAVQNAIQSVRD